MVRKGILTPFHNLKGYERRIEEPGPSNTNSEVNDLSSTSIARAVKLMSEAAKARPASMLLDPDSLPRLDAPTRPFLRLNTPFKIPQSPDSERGKPKDVNRKKKRPLPEKRWRKAASREENRLEGIGMSSNLVWFLLSELALGNNDIVYRYILKKT